MKKNLLHIFAVVCLACGLAACEDDRLFDPNYIGEGEADVTAEITFNSLTSALSRSVGGSGGEAGNAISSINQLCVVLYDEKGGYKHYFFNEEDLEGKIASTKDNPKDRPAEYDSLEGEHRAEEATQKATVSLGTVPYGKYRIYAVANIDEEDLTDDVLKDPQNLKKFELTWNSDKIGDNNQMFGYFSTDDSSNGFDAPSMIINRPTMTIKAWIKRAVSKVTVAFDGTGLNPGVQIFIKSVAIKDIPENCYLGANYPAEPEKEIKLIESGQVITYGEGKAEGICVENIPGHRILGYEGFANEDSEGPLSEEQVRSMLAELHSETTSGFYFFENLQGKGKDGTMSDKRQQVNEAAIKKGEPSYPKGVEPSNEAWKDTKKYGSYIEVKAYYVQKKEVNGETVIGNEGEGNIVYRFMLGKDTHLDYNAERNFHYKLTLKFKYWANDIDWHIDYHQGPDEKIRVPRPFFISYLYGQPTMIPLEFECDEDVTIEEVRAKITSNAWGPLNAPTKEGYSSDNQPNEEDYTKFWRYVSNTSVNSPSAFPWNGFLALEKPVNLQVLTGTPPWTVNSNESHYDSEGLGSRVFNGSDVEESEIPLYQAMAEDKLYVERVNRTYFVKVPIWTRARQLIQQTAYTGSNPYEMFMRQALVDVEIDLSNGHTLKSNEFTNALGQTENLGSIEVNQVERVINPTGIWRSKDNNEDFHVELKVLAEDEYNFKNLKSVGEWRAYVMYESNSGFNLQNGEEGFIKLEKTLPESNDKEVTSFYDLEEKQKMSRPSIVGKDCDIAFKIKFEGESPTPRYAMIRVEYNYNSCYHLIFVRQGYDADDTFEDGRKWCTRNNYDQNNLADNPLDEGSLFKFGNWTGIKSESNVNSKSPWTFIVPNDFLDNIAGANLKWTDGATAGWDHVSSAGVDAVFATPGGDRRVATEEDYMSLIPDYSNADQVESWPIKVGFGVLYGDGATGTAETIDDAFGYKVGVEGSSSKGMRGCFVYNRKNGRNLFFPLGSSGYGHRKNSTLVGATGVLRYSCNGRWGYFNAVTQQYINGLFSAPLFLDIFRAQGAVYWFEKKGTYFSDDIKWNVAWDINAKTYDFNVITTQDLEEGKDACFVRCIEN